MAFGARLKRLRFTLCWALAFVAGASAGSAAAQETAYTYWSDGPVLARASGEAVWVQAAEASDWRAVLDLRAAGLPGARVSGFQCAPVLPVCLVGLSRPGSDQQSWVRVSTDGSGEALVALETQAGLTVHDLTESDGVVALVSRWPGTPGPFGGGLYLWRLDQPASGARLISADMFVAQPGAAAFVNTAGRPMILNREPGAIIWAVHDLSGERIGARPAAGQNFAVDRRTLLTPVAASAANPPDLPAGSLLVSTAPLEPNTAWPQAVAFRADAFAIVDQDGESPAWSALSMSADGALVGVFQGSDGIDVRELCLADGRIQTRALAGERPRIAHAQMDSASGARQPLVRLTDPWGTKAQYAVVPPADFRRGTSVRACDGPALRLERLSATLPANPELTVETRTVAADDNTAVPYVVLGREGAVGPVMIRPYGAFGSPVRAHAVDRVEQQWLQRGNRLVVPTLRGDSGSREWVLAGRGDYKARATADLLAVADDLTRSDLADAGRLVLVGRSAGAVVAARAALTRPELFDAVVLFSGAMDLSLLDTVSDEEFGPKVAGFDWMEARPAPTDGGPRFLLWHALDDDRVPVASSAAFAAFLGGLGYHGVLTTSDRGGHSPSLREDTAADVLTFIHAAPPDQAAPDSVDRRPS